MVEPENFTKYTYNYDGIDYTFAQLCCHFGLKYMNVWWKVRYNGMTVEEAIKTCINDPHCWGVTYSDGTLALMTEEAKAESKRKRIEAWKKTMKEKGYHKNGRTPNVCEDDNR